MVNSKKMQSICTNYCQLTCLFNLSIEDKVSAKKENKLIKLYFNNNFYIDEHIYIRNGFDDKQNICSNKNIVMETKFLDGLCIRLALVALRQLNHVFTDTDDSNSKKY